MELDNNENNANDNNIDMKMSDDNDNNNNNNVKKVKKMKKKSKKTKDYKFPERATRAIKENHGCFIESIELCPFKGYGNLLCSVGGNQVSVYDCTHRGNFFDLVSNYYNFPNVDSKNMNIKNDTDVPDTKAAYKQKSIKYTSEEIKSVAFNDVTWVKRDNQNDLWVVAGCNDGNIYVISVTWSKCVLVFPASKKPIKQVLTYSDENYSSRVIVTTDSDYVTKFWDLDSIDKTKLKWDENGYIINDQVFDCLFEIDDDLDCMLFSKRNNQNDNNFKCLLHGITANGHFKTYSIDVHYTSNSSNDNDNKNNDNDNDNGNDSDDNDDDIDIDIMMSANNNKNKNNVNDNKGCSKPNERWSYSVLSEKRIQYKNTKHNQVRAVNMKWRPGKHISNQVVLIDVEGRFWLMNAESGEVLHRFEVHGGITLEADMDLPQYSFDIHPNGKFLAYGNDCGLVYIYDLESKQDVKKLKALNNRSTGSIMHTRWAPPNNHSIIVSSEANLWKYDRFKWVETYHDTNAFFQHLKPFSQIKQTRKSYVNF